MSGMWSKKWMIALGVLLAVGGGLACAKKVAPPPVETPMVAPTPLPPATVFGGESSDALRVAESRFKDVHFAYDSSALDATGQAVLAENFSTMKLYPGIKLEIEGHCDERGTSEYNMALGQRRANAVRDYLVRLGASAAGLQTISYGKEVPLDPGHTEAAWAKNRRAHVRVVSIGP